MNKLPSTIAGFPVESSDAKSPVGRQRGIALLMAIMIVSIVFTFSTDLVISSRVAIENAMRHRDDVKSEYMAKSAFNLALFLLSMDFGIDIATASGKFGPATKMTDSIGDIWSMMNGLPIGGGTLEMMAATQESFDLNAVNDDKVLSTLKQFDGEFILNINDESSKINVNSCAFKQGNSDRCKNQLAMAEALMSCPAEKAFLKSKNVEPKELTYRIRDWVDEDQDASSESGLNDESDAYQKKNPPYKAKNAQFDSIDELKMIEGWDDELHTIFSPYLTVYPFAIQSDKKVRKININTASRELLGCLFPNAKVECNEKFEVGMKKRGEDKAELSKDPANIASTLKELFCYQGSDGTAGSDRNAWFDTRSDVFSIVAKGEVGNQTKTISAVIERVMPDKAKKIERSYALLHWKII